MIVAVLEAGEFAAEFAEALPALVRIFHIVQGVEIGSEFGDGHAGEVFEEVAGFDAVEGGTGFGDVLDAGLAGLVFAPILITALTPVGEIGGGDGFIVEFLGEEFAGFGQSV